VPLRGDKFIGEFEDDNHSLHVYGTCFSFLFFLYFFLLLKLFRVLVSKKTCKYISMLLIPGIFIQLIHQPTYELYKLQFMTNINLLHVLAPMCHPQGVFQITEI